MDSLYPLANASFMALLLLALAHTLAMPRLRWLVVLPAAAALGDYMQNVAAWILLVRGVDASTWAEHLVALGDAVKVSGSMVTWLVLGIGWAGVLVRRCRQRTAHSSPGCVQGGLSPTAKAYQAHRKP